MRLHSAFFITLYLSLVIVLMQLTIQPAFASYLYLSPNNASTSPGSNLSFKIKLNTGGDVINGVSAYLTFPQDKLEVTSLDINEENLPIVAEKTIKGNVIKLSGANLSSINGSDLTIGTVNFKARTNGSASVNFVPGSAVPRMLDSSDSFNLASSQGANIQISDSGNTGSVFSSGSLAPQASGKPIFCRDHQDDFKNQLKNVSNSMDSIKARLDTIYALVDDYYNSSGKNLNVYNIQRQTVDVRRISVLTQMNNFQTQSKNFDCNQSNPRDRSNQIKQLAQQSVNSFNDYKQALIDLIGVLKKNINL